MTTQEPKYLTYAKSLIGIKEIKGLTNNSKISQWLRELKAWWNNDETPWCGVFVAHVLQKSNLKYAKEYARARDWATYGEKCGRELGAIVVLSRDGGGHVGFLTNVSGGKIELLGGNQGDSVSRAWFDESRVIAYRKPVGIILTAIVDKNIKVAKSFYSKSEA